MPPALSHPTVFDPFQPASQAQIPPPRSDVDTTQLAAVDVPAWRDSRRLTSEVFAAALAWHGDRRHDADTITLYKANRMIAPVLTRYTVADILAWQDHVAAAEQHVRWRWAVAVMAKAYPGMCSRRPLNSAPPRAARDQAHCA